MQQQPDKDETTRQQRQQITEVGVLSEISASFKKKAQNWKTHGFVKPSSSMADQSPDSNDSEIDISHEELMKLTSSALADLLPKDPVLRDLPCEVTLEEVNAQIALQFGRSMTVYVVRGNGEELPIVVPQGTATVQDLKHALKRFMTLRLMRQKSSVKISWRHIWRTHWLQYESQPLKEDKKLLLSYNIHNRSRVVFAKRLRERRKR